MSQGVFRLAELGVKWPSQHYKGHVEPVSSPNHTSGGSKDNVQTMSCAGWSKSSRMHSERYIFSGHDRKLSKVLFHQENCSFFKGSWFLIMWYSKHKKFLYVMLTMKAQISRCICAVRSGHWCQLRETDILLWEKTLVKNDLLPFWEEVYSKRIEFAP